MDLRYRYVVLSSFSYSANFVIQRTRSTHPSLRIFEFHELLKYSHLRDNRTTHYIDSEYQSCSHSGSQSHVHSKRRSRIILVPNPFTSAPSPIPSTSYCQLASERLGTFSLHRGHSMRHDTPLAIIASTSGASLIDGIMDRHQYDLSYLFVSSPPSRHAKFKTPPTCLFSVPSHHEPISLSSWLLSFWSSWMVLLRQ
jgi:hypothetical protein